MSDLRHHIDQIEIVDRERALHRSRGEDEHVLVVNLIVGGLLDHIAEIGVFENEDAVGLSRRCTPAATPGKSGMWHMTFAAKMASAWPCSATISSARLRSKKALIVVNAVTTRDIRDVGRRLDAEMPHAARVKVTEHDAVIAAEFNHERIGTAAEHSR